MPSVTLSTNTTSARNDTSGNCGGACSMGNDVFYTFTLAAAEIVYVDSVGSTFDTTLFLQDMAGTNLTDPMMPLGAVCNDNGGIGCMTGMQSQLLARLPAGTYYLVLSGCGSGSATIHFQHLPVGNGPAVRIFPVVGGGSQIINGTTAGTGLITSTCCSDGPENTYYFVTCPAFSSDSFTATTCGGATWNTELDQRSATRTPLSV